MLPSDCEIEVLTYVSRGFEEYRGFPQAMQAIALLQAQSKLHVLMLAPTSLLMAAQGPTVAVKKGLSKMSLSTVINFIGWVPATEEYHDVLARCSPLSHCALRAELEPAEAMAAGCALVCSATPPVEEVLTHNSSALLVAFFPQAQQKNLLVYLMIPICAFPWLPTPRRVRLRIGPSMA